MKISKRKLFVILMLQVFLVGCVGLNTSDDRSTYKNPSPKIEQLHVKAYNLDLGKGGVKQNRAKANRLYLQAAKMGDPRSMMNYSLNRYYGKGIKQNKTDALCWIDKARFVTQRIKDLKVKWSVRRSRDHLKKESTKEEILKAVKKCNFMMAF